MLNKIPAYAGMTAFLVFQAAYGLLQGMGEQRGQRVAHLTVFRLPLDGAA
ncbi:MAG: hypothetical protein Q4A85_08050 [Kingella sp. (in: b-proteobacteria)]|nr:hypothetical protein [Kingella sp. (in: b-proteobacteria)]